jgi:hypothetical protein
MAPSPATKTNAIEPGDKQEARGRLNQRASLCDLLRPMAERYRVSLILRTLRKLIAAAAII